jgi:RNA polymerase sigma factor (sigma-70 family)
MDDAPRQPLAWFSIFMQNGRILARGWLGHPPGYLGLCCATRYAPMRRCSMAEPNNRLVTPDGPAAWMQEYEAEIYTFLRKNLRSGMPSDAANDVFGDWCLKLVENERHIRASDDIEAYLFRMAKNAICDYVRRTCARNEALQRVARRQPTTGSPTFDQVQSNEFSERLWKGIEALTLRNRAVFVGRFVERKSFKELSRRFRRNRHTLSKDAMRAMCQIKRSMRNLLNDPPL